MLEKSLNGKSFEKWYIKLNTAKRTDGQAKKSFLQIFILTFNYFYNNILWSKFRILFYIGTYAWKLLND